MFLATGRLPWRYRRGIRGGEQRQMIQPILGSFAHKLTLNAGTSSPISEESAFRNWKSRRDGARQQIGRLSRRELQVVQLVSMGLANKTIALELEISVKTIEKHRANATRKLGVGSTAELVRLAVLADYEMETRPRFSTAGNHTHVSGVHDN